MPTNRYDGEMATTNLGVPIMAKVKKPVEKKPTGKMVRLELQPKDYKRLEMQAKLRSLTLASYARMAVVERLTTDEEKAK
jgi:hypothetical protein